MTKEQAQKELENTETWKDFEYWAYLKLTAQGLDVGEVVKKMEEATALHKVREARVNLQDAEESLLMTRMRHAGATDGEINRRAGEHHKREIIDAWRMLD
jgi:hypothetical protein